jgi:thymidylate synthase ThyX
MDEFTDEEQRMLSPYFSNMDKPVFVLMNLPEVVKGALFSRYSRSSKSLRRVLLEEFMLSDDMKGVILRPAGDVSKNDPIQTRKAEEFYDRVLVGYGDDSVAELAGAHIALEDISILATKIVEDARLGLSPLEKSTRYVYFDTKRDGRWMYLREKTLMGSEFADVYTKSCDMCFETYARLVPKVSKHIMELEPKDGSTTDRAYSASIRAKTCDILRGLLPASTLTNMGFYGDGRAFEFLMTKMYSDQLSEVRELALTMQTELGKAIPSFVKRANNEHGKAMQEYYIRVRKGMEGIASEHAGATGPGEKVTLVDYDKDAERRIIIAALYPYLQKPMAEIASIVDRMDDKEKEAVIKAYVNERQNRRQKPGRGFEQAYYTFDICANFGAYRDMHRHRILTQQRQTLTPYLGYKLPKGLVEAGYESEFKDAMDNARNAYDEISKKHGKEAQYAVPLAYNIRWHMTLNLREAYHMLELRSAMQGHQDYRQIAQEMFRQIASVHPRLAFGMRFMDMKEYSLERLEAEKRIDKKLAEIDRKYAK